MIPGTREWIPHASYRLVYEVDEDHGAVWILALVHTARQWPPVPQWRGRASKRSHTASTPAPPATKPAPRRRGFLGGVVCTGSRLVMRW